MDFELEKTLEKFILTQAPWERLPNEVKAKLQVIFILGLFAFYFIRSQKNTNTNKSPINNNLK
jgi:hypothetical protein